MLSITARPSPTSDNARVSLLDVLRGIALLGIALVNIWSFAETTLGETLADTVVRATTAVFFLDKFHMLFGALFGCGIAMQLERTDGSRVRWARWSRRLLVLLLLGLVYDVLAVYAVAGAIVLLLHRLSPAGAVRVAGVLLLVTALLHWLLAIALTGGEPPAAAPAGPEWGTHRSGLAEWADSRVAALPQMLLALPDYLAMSLAGFAVGRAGLHRAAPSTALLRRVVVTGAAVGLPAAVASAVYPIAAGFTPAAVAVRGLSLLTAPALAAAYVAAVFLVHRSPHGARITGPFVPAGRTALTNYLAQGALLALLFSGHGFGLTDRLGPIAVVLVATGMFAVLCCAGAVWLRWFRFGPVEWLLRSATYWRRQPMRRAPAVGG